MNPRICFIGGGNMARSLIAGLIHSGSNAQDISVSEPMAEGRESLTRDYAVNAFAENVAAAERAHIWVLAVKPQVLRAVCTELSALAQNNQPLVISIAAGITSEQINRWLGGGQRVVRTMPNTPAMLGAGVTALFANSRCTLAQREQSEHILSSAGKTVWIDDEALMDAVTAVSGSGPAYIFLLAEAMQHAAIAEGLPAEAARVLSLQTIMGAARMLTETADDAATLRKKVTSPNGTTFAALQSLEQSDFVGVMRKAIHAARVRGAELSQANDEST